MQKYLNYLKYALFLGIALCIAGIVVGLVTGNWSLQPLILLAIGTLLIFIYLGFQLNSAQGFWRWRSTQAGTNALIATLAVLVILGLLNFLAIRYSIRIDLTENKLFTLSPQSQEIVQNLNQPLKVWIFGQDSNLDDQELLENYHRYSSNFDFEFVDPNVKFELAQRFNVQSSFSEVHLEYATKKKLVQTLNPGERLSEVQLTNAIEQIQSDRNISIYFLQGHGEPGLQTLEGGISQAVNSLKDKGYEVEMLNLASAPQIPDNANVIVIAGPKRKLFAGEVKVLKDYLNAGGSMLLMIDPNTDPGLESLLKDWGVELDSRLVIDPSPKLISLDFGPAAPLITAYGNHPITQDFSNGFSIYPLSRPVGTVEIKGINASALVVTNEQAWGENNLETQELTFNPKEDIEGPMDLGVALTRSKSKDKGKSEKREAEGISISPRPSPSPDKSTESKENKEAEGISISPRPSPSPDKSTESKENKEAEGISISPQPSPSPDKSTESKDKQKKEPEKKLESRLVVFGSSTFATNGWFERQLNGDVFINSVNWLAKTDEQNLSIRPKEQKNRRINLTPLQAGIIGWTALFIMPLLGIIAAVIAWWRRR